MHFIIFFPHSASTVHYSTALNECDYKKKCVHLFASTALQNSMSLSLPTVLSLLETFCLFYASYPPPPPPPPPQLSDSFPCLSLSCLPPPLFTESTVFPVYLSIAPSLPLFSAFLFFLLLSCIFFFSPFLLLPPGLFLSCSLPAFFFLLFLSLAPSLPLYLFLYPPCLFISSCTLPASFLFLQCLFLSLPESLTISFVCLFFLCYLPLH